MSTKEKTFLIRNTLSDDGHIPYPSTPTYSPDIICYQNKILSYMDATDSYGSYVCKSFRQDSVNLIYVRAKNNTGIAQNGEVKAYYSPLSLLYLPRQWKPLYTETGADTVKLRQLHKSEAEPDAIVLCDRAFLLRQVERPTEHHCMMALSRPEGGEWLSLPASFDGDSGLWAFLRQHSQIAYNNIVIEEGFHNEHTEAVMVGNHNDYEEEYVVRFSVVSNGHCVEDTFGSCNIGRIQMLCTDMESPFEINVYPQADRSETVSAPFSLPGHYERSIIITYHAADPRQKVYGTIRHDYMSCDRKLALPLQRPHNGIFLLSQRVSGEEVRIHPEAKLGDFAVVFAEHEKESVELLKSI